MKLIFGVCMLLYNAVTVAKTEPQKSKRRDVEALWSV